MWISRITNWEDMEKISSRCFSSEPQVDPHEHVVLMSGGTVTRKTYLETMTQIMLEKFSTPRLTLHAGQHYRSALREEQLCWC